MLKRKPFRLFYLVFGYTMAFSVWWGYLLFAKNETAFKELVTINRINYRPVNGIPYEKTKDYEKIQQKYSRQKVMILSEGSVFIFLLFGGLFLVNRVFKIEIEVADQQRNFLHSITHELKSPLASIKLAVQTIQRRELETQQRDQLLQNALGDVSRLEGLVDNILFAAKMESNAHGFAGEWLNASTVVQEQVNRMKQLTQHIQWQLNVMPDVELFVDKIGFVSVVVNLLENAVKYSGGSGLVAVELLKENQQVILRVKDEGEGIPEELRARVFEKFFRIGNENTRKTKGTGLGLFIVKRFVEINKGQIVVRENRPRGSIFEMTLPSP
ncbi:MAG: HAMP domain-containing sensor histidine kinase [Chitinophagales bacterium]